MSTEQSASGRSSVRTWAIAGALVVVAAYAGLGLRTGTTTDTDSLHLEASFQGILDGRYVPSRTSGFPAYEFLGAAAWVAAGRTGVMVLSLILTIAALLLLIRPTRARSTWIGLASWLFLALCPTILSNASAVMETSLLFFEVALLSWLLSQDWMGGRRGIAMTFLVGVSLTTTRPDAVLVSLATVAALAASSQPTTAKLFISGALGAGSLAGLAMVLLLTSQFPFRSDILLVESFARRLVRAGVGLSTAFSPLGALALLILGVLLVVRLRDLRARPKPSASTSPIPLDDPDFVVVWLLLALVLYGIRFLALPDEVEYLLPLMAVLAVAAPHLAARGRSLALVAVIALAGLASTSLVTLPLTQRQDPWDPNPALRPSIQSGAAVQDLEARSASDIRGQAAYQDFVARSLGDLEAQVQEGTLTLLPRDTWYEVLTEKYARLFEATRGVAGCEELTSRTEIPGWRISQPSGAFADASAFESGAGLHCGLVARIDAGSVTITPLGSGPKTPAGLVIRR